MRVRTPSGMVCIALVALVLAAGPVPAPAAARGEGTATSTSEPPESPDIIPEPGSGSEPEEAGDRGGSLQVGVFVLIIVGIGGIGALVVRDSRKARDERGF